MIRRYCSTCQPYSCMLLGGSFFVLVHTWSWSSDVERYKMRSQRFGLASEDFLEANDRVLIELVRSQTSTYSYLLVDLCKGSYAKSPLLKNPRISRTNFLQSPLQYQLETRLSSTRWMLQLVRSNWCILQNIRKIVCKHSIDGCGRSRPVWFKHQDAFFVILGFPEFWASFWFVVLRMAMEVWKLKRFGTEAEDVDAFCLVGRNVFSRLVGVR